MTATRLFGARAEAWQRLAAIGVDRRLAKRRNDVDLIGEHTSDDHSGRLSSDRHAHDRSVEFVMTPLTANRRNVSDRAPEGIGDPERRWNPRVSPLLLVRTSLVS